MKTIKISFMLKNVWLLIFITGLAIFIQACVTRASEKSLSQVDKSVSENSITKKSVTPSASAESSPKTAPTNSSHSGNASHRNALAMQTAKHLGMVKGDLRLLNTDLYPAANFAQAIDYADSMDSYALLIWHKGALRLEHYFQGFDAELRPETASMHKSVLGLLIAAAIEDGFIKSVDDPIGRYIKAWENKPQGRVSVRHLLTMSSGLQSLDSQGGLNSEAMKFSLGHLNARATILGLGLETQPGKRFAYANTNSQLLGIVLEAATNMPYEKYLSERLWKPIGADDASVWYFEGDTFPRTFSSLFARPRDWIKVGLLIKNYGTLNNKSILSRQSISAMSRSSNTNINYGWQLWLGKEYRPKRFYNDASLGFAIPASEPFAAKDMIYFDGFGGQRVYISDEHDLVIVRAGHTRLDWDDSYIPNAIIRTISGIKQ